MKSTEIDYNDKQIFITSQYLGNKEWHAQRQNYHNHTLIVSFQENHIPFEFWGSLAQPEIQTDDQNISAFYCFLSDAVAGDMDFNEFCNTFGYDIDTPEAENVWNACYEATQKVKSTFDDLYELMDFLKKKHHV